MSLEHQYKIKSLLKDWPKGTVCLTSWLTANGYSNQLLHRYKKSHWIERIGLGAVKQSGDTISVEGALYALQHQAKSSIHFGGKTALALLGRSHYLEFSTKRVVLFGSEGETLPSWMVQYPWGVTLDYYGSSFLPKGLGLVSKEVKNVTLNLSSAPRALMECLYLAPQKQDLVECYELMEGLSNIRPSSVQSLLEACTSVKVKRLFLYMAEKAKHSWLQHLDLEQIDVGTGNRSIVKNGVYIASHQITVPKELASYGIL